MSENIPERGRHHQEAIDQLLAGSGHEGDAALRTELLELRSLASTVPLPSDAVRALMSGSPADATRQLTTTDGPAARSGAPAAVPATVEPSHGPGPVDELAARRRNKRRAAIAGLAVAVTLAGGATAAAASEGGIPGAFQHLGAAIGSVVSQLAPGSGTAPQQGGSGGSSPQPPLDETRTVPAPNQPAPANPSPGTPGHVPQPHPGGEGSSQTPKAPQHDVPGKGVIPTPPAVPVTPPALDAPKIDPSELRPSDLPVPVPTHVVPKVPDTP
ncbi:hypothetical protein SAMN04487917_107103 [Arthrobacter sp. yr096]|uniref:hypothetical protein n=1 Tax=Arthrobacter sp. yr096 TaxID=1761750 RepID=UPI0008CA8891|nr:hypothetical protein [Arthrobacter sp. yr096]SEJ56829.1 hypothetical protein SAMN04487917_107103 [Arthrobacter sp. yr096]